MIMTEAILLNDLAMLIEAREAVSEEYYRSQYNKITQSLKDLENGENS